MYAFRDKKTHVVYIWPRFFSAMLKGFQTFVVKKDTQNYQIGDSLTLQERRQEDNSQTGREIMAEVTYVQRRSQGIVDGFAVIGFKVIGTVDQRLGGVKRERKQDYR